MPVVYVWHGTDTDLEYLHAVIEKNCGGCVYDRAGVRTKTCGAHQLLIDQKMLDRFAFLAHERTKYINAEFDPMAEWL